MVYGTVTDAGKPDFLAELHRLRQVSAGPWLLYGYFNMIYRAEDKNNPRLNRRLMGQFRRFLNDVVHKEIHLQGRLFTWSNERAHPMFEHIDCAFTSNEWEELFPNCDFHPYLCYALIMHDLLSG
jgi:hypothetical protein